MRTFLLTLAVIALSALLLLLLSTAPHPAHAAGFNELTLFDKRVPKNLDRMQVMVAAVPFSPEKPREGCSNCYGGLTVGELFAKTVGEPDKFIVLSVRRATMPSQTGTETTFEFFYIAKEKYPQKFDCGSEDSETRCTSFSRY